MFATKLKARLKPKRFIFDVAGIRILLDFKCCLCHPLRRSVCEL